MKYRDMAVAAYRLHPKPYVFHPSNMKPSSVASKVRDAIRGRLAFEYPGDDIPTDDLAQWYSEVVIKHDDFNVYIGPAEGIKDVLKGHETLRDASLTFPSLDFEEVAAFMLLISRGRLTGPISILAPPELSLLQPRPNVEMISKPDGTLVLI